MRRVFISGETLAGKRFCTNEENYEEMLDLLSPYRYTFYNKHSTLVIKSAEANILSLELGHEFFDVYKIRIKEWYLALKKLKDSGYEFSEEAEQEYKKYKLEYELTHPPKEEVEQAKEEPFRATIYECAKYGNTMRHFPTCLRNCPKALTINGTEKMCGFLFCYKEQ